MDQAPHDVITSPTLLGSVLVWSQPNYWRLLKTVKYWFLWLLPLRDLPQRKNEC